MPSYAVLQKPCQEKNTEEDYQFIRVLYSTGTGTILYVHFVQYIYRHGEGGGGWLGERSKVCTRVPREVDSLLVILPLAMKPLFIIPLAVLGTCATLSATTPLARTEKGGACRSGAKAKNNGAVEVAQK